jgi:hypothetical protein
MAIGHFLEHRNNDGQVGIDIVDNVKSEPSFDLSLTVGLRSRARLKDKGRFWAIVHKKTKMRRRMR